MTITVILFLSFALWGGLVAHSKGRNVVGYAALAGAFPLIGILTAYLMPTLRKPELLT